MSCVNDDGDNVRNRPLKCWRRLALSVCLESYPYWDADVSLLEEDLDEE
jgi:hypothetical protein